LDYGFSSPFWKIGGGNKKNNLYTTFYFAGIANFLFGREEGIKPSPAAAIVW
jgi:hypothetical protein